jgi:hypothetical protein
MGVGHGASRMGPLAFPSPRHYAPVVVLGCMGPPLKPCRSRPSSHLMMPVMNGGAEGPLLSPEAAQTSGLSQRGTICRGHSAGAARGAAGGRPGPAARAPLRACAWASPLACIARSDWPADRWHRPMIVGPDHHISHILLSFSTTARDYTRDYTQGRMTMRGCSPHTARLSVAPRVLPTPSPRSPATALAPPNAANAAILASGTHTRKCRAASPRSTARHSTRPPLPPRFVQYLRAWGSGQSLQSHGDAAQARASGNPLPRWTWGACRSCYHHE